MWQNIRLSQSSSVALKGKHTSQSQNNIESYAETQPAIGSQKKEIS